LRARIHFASSTDGSLQRAFIDALANAGVTSAQNDAPPSIVFFTGVTAEFLALLWEASSGGAERVLAIAAGDSDLQHTAWQALKAGATDVLSWDHSSNPALDVAARLERWQAVDELVQSPVLRNTLVGQGPRWIKHLRRIIELGRFTDSDILILGEPGTGKELVARVIHQLDSRPDKGPLIVLDCATVVPELSGSEFFGHERGAFTGALHAREGAFELANGGTLFLDEVGELPLPIQGQLLRAVQERMFKHVGGNTWQSSKFRLICATNRDLLESVKRGEFRDDLYYRIASSIVRLPPLRERTDEILELARYFIQQASKRPETPELDPAVSAYLVHREYSGNVRELRHLISRMMDNHIGSGPITPGDVPEDDRPQDESDWSCWRDARFEAAILRALSAGMGLKDIGRAAEETAIALAVNQANGSLQRAASTLRVTDRALQMRRAVAGRAQRAS
jgi:transcriptional regulator with GAF, ATPase, and Fis domain